VEHLSLNFNCIGAAGGIMLSHSENSRNLKRLELETNELKDEGMESLAMSPNLINIEYLNVKQNEIKDEGARSIAIGSMRKLNFLNINQNEISDKGYKAIAESDQLPLLTELHIYEGNITTSIEPKNSLKRSKKLKALKYLY